MNMDGAKDNINPSRKMINRTKKYLRELHSQEIKLEHALDELSQYKTRIEKIKYQFDRQKKSESLKKLEIQLNTLENNVNTRIFNCQNTKDEVVKKIYKINDDRLIYLLYQHHVNNKTLEEIAANMNYSYEHIQRQYRKAIEKFAIINNDIM